MEHLLKTSVLKADKKAALQIAKSLESHKVFACKIENDLITIKAPLKDDAGEWIRNEEGKIKRFLVFEWSNKLGKQSIRYNPDAIVMQ